MNKYRDKSNFEINKAVAATIGAKPFPPERTEFKLCEIPRLENAIIVKITGVKTGPFDPCNNPADAMPIVIENGISSLFNDDEWICSVPYTEFLSINESLYRAAMEVFLMMKDAENES